MKKNDLKITYQVFNNVQELTADDFVLAEYAIKAADTAYAPYSGFHVGASLRLKNGKIVNGSNQENSAYPSGLCAERVALFYAGSQYPDTAIEAMAITARTPGKKLKMIVKPCGACRQVMAETAMRQKSPFRIILIGEDGNGLVFESIADLLPFSFEFE
ncbi:MAG: cytidine deaminase [Bacteroidetes bacterium HGW-Bacteroidetes-6]|jgi:cytidine deaminase|nr:MAG: cytidine deaminase [Bacteroidetes bacterium HGW-Bacteroidetes-6]